MRPSLRATLLVVCCGVVENTTEFWWDETERLLLHNQHPNVMMLLESATGEFVLRASQVPRAGDSDNVRVKLGEPFEKAMAAALTVRPSSTKRLRFSPST